MECMVCGEEKNFGFISIEVSDICRSNGQMEAMRLEMKRLKSENASLMQLNSTLHAEVRTAVIERDSTVNKFNALNHAYDAIKILFSEVDSLCIGYAISWPQKLRLLYEDWKFLYKKAEDQKVKFPDGIYIIRHKELGWMLGTYSCKTGWLDQFQNSIEESKVVEMKKQVTLNKVGELISQFPMVDGYRWDTVRFGKETK